jgi:hypothetical protein
MDIILWIAAGLLALVALAGGFTKTFIPKEKLEHHDGAAWTRGVSPAFVKTLGVLELLAAIGLIQSALLSRPGGPNQRTAGGPWTRDAQGR